MKTCDKFVKPRGAIFATICVSALALPLFADSVQVDTNAYAHTFCISFPGYSGSTTLTNFPALIRLSAELNNFRYSECMDDGGDLRFADAEGNLLASEIDTWNTNGESLVWVRVPEFNNETKIKAYYGCANPPAVTASDVWDNGYVGVWHMNSASGSTNQSDSTATPIELTTARGNNIYQNGSRAGVDGMIGAAAEFRLRSDGKGGYRGFDQTGKLDGFQSLTVEAWTSQREMYTNFAYLVSKRANDGNGNANRSYRFMVQQKITRPVFFYYYNVTNVLEEISHWPGSPNLASNSWYHQAHVYNGATGYKAWFLDGVSKSSSTTAQKVGTLNSLPKGEIFIGNWDDQWSTGAFPGKIDEVRISSVARSSDWLKASHDIVADEEFTSYEEANDWAKYAHKFAISFTNYTGTATLEDFPVLVRISEGAIVGFSYDDCLKPGGADLRFADEGGALLDSEVEDWNPQGESLVWVKVPEFRNGTKLTGYYGWQFAPAVNSKAVWSNGYVGVWHMDEDNDKTLLANSIWHGKPFKRTNTVDTNGVAYAENMTNGVDGVVGTAVKFNGGSAKGMYYIDDNVGTFDGFGAFTVEAWTWQDDHVPTENERQGYVLRMYDGSTTESWSVYEMSQQVKGVVTFAFSIDSVGKYVGMPTDAERPTRAEWNHSVGVWNGTTGVRNMFLNGANLTNHREGESDVSNYMGTMSMQTNRNSRLCFGNNWNGGTSQFSGCVDEVRISNVERSADWIKASYDTVKSASFASFGRARQNGVKGFFLMLR